MAKIKEYSSVEEFSKKVLRLGDYDRWLISFKVKLIKTIVQERKDKNFSQKDLAEILGTTQSVISRIESGVSRSLTIDYLLKILLALGVSPNKALRKVA